MSWTFFIVNEATHGQTNWAPNAWLNVSPIPIRGGSETGGYAVNVEIFTSDPAFEAYRSLLESMPTAVCDDLDEWFPPPDE